VLDYLPDRWILRAWYAPGDRGARESVYGNEEAVQLANVASEPALKEKPISAKGLSQQDLSVIQLWFLSTTSISPETGQPGLQAAKLDRPSEPDGNQRLRLESTASVTQLPTAPAAMHSWAH
jgi:hypothetical protein